MSFILLLEERKAVITIKKIRLNAKFKCLIDVFLKIGSSEKIDLLKNLSIQSGFVSLSENKSDSKPQQIPCNKFKKTAQVQPKIKLEFEIKSSSYNVYAGQVLIDTTKTNTECQVEISDCVDSEAFVIYRIEDYSDNAVQAQIQFHKDFSIKPFEVQQKPGPQKASPKKPKWNSPKHALKIPSNLKEYCNKNEISLDSPHLKKAIKETTTKTLKTTKSLDISRVLSLQNFLDDEKQKTCKLELEISSCRIQVKEANKKVKTLENKLRNVEIELSKTKKELLSYHKQRERAENESRKSLSLLEEKIQGLEILLKRHQGKERSYKDQLRNVYQKLQASKKQQGMKKSDSLDVDQKVEQIKKKLIDEHEEKVSFFKVQEQKMKAAIKSKEGDLREFNEEVSKEVKKTCKRIEDLLNRDSRNGNKTTLNLMPVFQEDFSTSYSEEYDEYSHKNYSYFLKSIQSKVEVFSVDMKNLVKTTQQNLLEKEIQIKDLGASARKAQTTIEALQEEMDSLKSKNKQTIQSLEEEKEHLTELHAKKQKNYKRTISEQQIENERLTSLTSCQKKQISSLKSQNQQLAGEVENVKNQNLRQKKAHAQLLRATIKQKDDAYEELNSECKRRQNNIKSLTSRNKDLTDELDTVKSAKDNLERKNAQKQQEIKRLQDEVSELQVENGKVAKKLQNCEENLKSSMEQTNVFKTEVSEFMSVIEEIIGRRLGLSGEIAMSQNRAFRDQVSNYKLHYKNLCDQKSRLEEELEAIKKEASGLKAEISKIREEKRKLEEERNKIEQIFNKNSKTDEGLRKSVLQMKKELDQMRNRLQQKEDFEAELEDEFQCEYSQIREKLDYYINLQKQTEKEKAFIEREANTKNRKFHQVIESLNKELGLLNKFFQDVQADLKILPINLAEAKKGVEKVEKETGASVFYFTPIKNSIQKSEQLYEKTCLKFEKLDKDLEEPRQQRNKSSLTRKTSVARKQSFIGQQEKPKGLIRNNSISASSIGGLTRKLEELKVTPEMKGSSELKKSGQLSEEDEKVFKDGKMVASKVKAQRQNTNSPTLQKKKTVKRLNTMK